MASGNVNIVVASAQVELDVDFHTAKLGQGGGDQQDWVQILSL